VPPFSELKRTHTCGEIRPTHVGRRVCLNGWVHGYRNLGGVLFIDLRDTYGLTQIVVNPESIAPDMHRAAERSRAEFVVAVRGVVRERPDGSVNPKLDTGAIEVAAEEYHILSESETPPFEIVDDPHASEQLRFEFRYLDLRRKPLQDNLKLRHDVTLAVRNHMSSVGFREIETPMLIRSTPEGARDYVVPSRIYKGRFYALPQSPQLLKQILMIAGFDRYFQIARCLRDEDLRSDRQPEHTQIDMEMSFVTPEDVFAVIEELMTYLFKAVLNVSVESPFPRLTYDEVMSRWGVDKPDLRFGMEIVDLSDDVRDCGFRVFAENVGSGGVVKGIVLPGGAALSRKQLDEVSEKAKAFGAGGLAWVLRDESGDRSPILKFIGDSVKDGLCQRAKAGKGDALFIVSDKPGATEKILGQLRLHLARQQGLIPPDVYRFLWVTDFPLFEFDEESGRLAAMHNIVSHPLEEHVSLIDEGFGSAIAVADPGHPWRRVKALQYDLVVNGWEIGSGGQRINRRELQEKVLEILGIDRQRAERMFGFLLRALQYGAPPHAGIALGLDRLVCLMAGTANIRDVIAFPKTTNATSLMDNCPAPIDPEQLQELGLIVKGGDAAGIGER